MARVSSLFILVLTIVLSSCEQRRLPIYGIKELDETGDTIYHQIPSFAFVNQDGTKITEKDYHNQVYVADFFFTTCPGICPIMTDGLQRVQGYLKDNDLNVKILSHTVDPETDSAATMKAYGLKKGADFSSWDFVTGKKKNLYQMAEHYLVVANEDPNTEINFVHSDKLILVDKQSRIRGMYSGVDDKEVDQLIEDIEVLLKEEQK